MLSKTKYLDEKRALFTRRINTKLERHIVRYVYLSNERIKDYFEIKSSRFNI